MRPSALVNTTLPLATTRLVSSYRSTSSAKNFRFGPSMAAWSIRCRWSPTRSNFQLEATETPSGRFVVVVGCAGVGWGGAGAAVCASAAAAQRHATHESRKPLVALRYTLNLEELPQDITPDFALRASSRQAEETFANCSGEKNRARNARRLRSRQWRYQSPHQDRRSPRRCVPHL